MILTNKNSKGTLRPILLLALSLVLIAGVGYYASTISQTRKRTPIPYVTEYSATDPRAFSKTYKEDRYGNFEFKYPFYMFLNKSKLSTAPIEQFEYGALPKNNAVIITDVFWRNKSMPLEEWIGEKPFHPHLKDVETASKSTIEIAGKESRLFVYRYPREKQVGKVVFIPSGKFTEESGAEVVVQIDFYYYEDDPREEFYNKIFDQILSTFQFID